MKITAMTYNICSGKNMARERDLNFAASVIREVQPDFVTLNEVRSRTDDIGDIDQANELGRLTGYYPLFGRSIDILGGEYGNALLTRLPVIKYDIVHIPDFTPTMKGFYEHRTILRCVLAAGDKNVTVLCTHFGLMPSEQKSAVETVLALLAETDGPVLLMGDLNMTPDAEILQPILYAMHDTADNRNSPLTFPSDEPRQKIDYILHSGPAKTISLRTMDTQNSDHRPLIAEIEI